MDTLSGRALDAALAQRLFGYEIEERTNTLTHKPEILRRLDNNQWVIVSYYSTRMSAGLEVGERLRRLGWTLNEASSNRRPDAAGLHRVALDGPQGLRVSASAETWELALARAALKAVTLMP